MTQVKYYNRSGVLKEHQNNGYSIVYFYDVKKEEIVLTSDVEKIKSTKLKS